MKPAGGDIQIITNDPRFSKALDLFNSAQWYLAHDAFEELWFEAYGPERKILQGLLQIAVAQLHLEKGNNVGATILYGEGLGRLRSTGIPDLGIDLDLVCNCVQSRLEALQQELDPEKCSTPVLQDKPRLK